MRARRAPTGAPASAEREHLQERSNPGGPTLDVRAVLEQLDAELAHVDQREAAPILVFLAAAAVDVDEDELRAARRRAMLLLAAGGDPHRELDVGGRPVRSLAADLDAPARRAQLDAALAELADAARDLPHAARVLRVLQADADLAWRSLACALLAEELAAAE